MSEIPSPAQIPTETQPAAELTEVRHSTPGLMDRAKGRLALFGISASLMGAIAPATEAVANTTAGPTPSAETAKSNKTHVPAISPGETVDEAKASLQKPQKTNLIYGGMTDGKRIDEAKDKKVTIQARSGFHLVVDGWSKKLIKKIKKNGRLATKETPSPILSPTAPLKKNTTVYAHVKEVADQAPAANTSVTGSQAGQSAPSSTSSSETAPIQAPAKPAPGPSETIPTPPTHEGPIKVDAAAERAKFFKEHSVVIPFMNNCSGLEISDPVSQIVLTATHCGTYGLTRVPDPATGELSMFFNQPLDIIQPVKDDLSQVKSIGPAKQIILPKEGNQTNDTAVIILKGSPQQGLDLYNRHRPSAQSIASVGKSGKTLYSGGFPSLYPSGSTTGTQSKREVLELHPIGVAMSDINNGYNGLHMQTLWTGMKPNADNAICAPGQSGAGSVEEQKVIDPNGNESMTYTFWGTQLSVDDFRPASQNIFGYDGTGTKALRESQSGLKFAPGDAAGCYVDINPVLLSNSDVVTARTYATTTISGASALRGSMQVSGAVKNQFVHPKPDISHINEGPVLTP